MLGSIIANYRRKLGLTQDQLAQKLDVTNQAVSKWETDQCCPDVALLPKLADIFGISIDELFGRKSAKTAAQKLPWDNDDALHIVLYNGHTLVGAVSKDNQDCTFNYEGPAKDIYCAVNLVCGDVVGNVTADGYVECDSIGGDVYAGSYIESDSVGGNVCAGTYIECGEVGGNVCAGTYIECGDIGGDVQAGGYVECGNVGGNVNACGYVECGEVGGSVSGDYGGCSSFGNCGGCSSFGNK